MIILTGFADEISDDLEKQLDVMASEGIAHLELRSVWGKNVLQLTDQEAAHIKERLEDRGFKVSSIGSPLGKIGIADDFAAHMKDAERAVQLAKYFGAPYIRIFSFFLPEGEAAEGYRDQVMFRMKQFTQLAEQSGVVMLLENETEVYGDIAERCLDILETCRSSQLQAAFDPANYVQCGESPISKSYPLVAPFVSYIHVKDAIMGSGKVVPAGEGDGELRRLLSILKEKEYDGFMSLEPHLASTGRFEGFGGEQLFAAAAKALKELLREADLSWM
ncbi:sugar phosphate isomerase/epimerase [Cohnella pontilimi]|uniref:Sugar phosphate isomerase/epimerase n=1 Tax=Cohnella pontilimi TaxID=2564100 RepID=A0A4V5LSB7_9BACL|nr:sugar phosphate isomerase/epimerase family protein [Cohnella pontilimi]TJY42419.1 sugar phosphate isomerase/epimerase [Cohnella pontilimi]